MLRIMAKKVPQHVQHQNHRRDEVKDSSNDCMPEALAIGLFWSMGRHVFVHRCGDSDELALSAITMRLEQLKSGGHVDTTGWMTERGKVVEKWS